jgi:hypothetical protein
LKAVKDTNSGQSFHDRFGNCIGIFFINLNLAWPAILSYSFMYSLALHKGFPLQTKFTELR